MNEIDLGEGCFARMSTSDCVSLLERYNDLEIEDVVNFPPEQMDALCKWWLEQRGSVQLLEIAALAVAEAAAKEQQAIEAHIISEREDRAFDALIVLNRLRDRDFNDLNDLPPLTESQRKSMESTPDDIVERMWKQTEAQKEHQQ